MLSHLLGVSRAELYLDKYSINNDILEKFSAYAEERLRGRPIQYILGKTEFMGLEFLVTPDVFIPRPETELLVEKTIGLIKTVDRRPGTADQLRILDLGTGSGNIAIALTKFVSACKIIVSDISKEALCIAKKNARKNGVEERIEFVLSDLFADFAGAEFDIVVSNPPYVASADIDKLDKEISFEPRMALDGGADGFDFYRRIINETGRFLKRNGFLILELGFGQADEIEELLYKNNFENIIIYKDYNIINRVGIAQWIG